MTLPPPVPALPDPKDMAPLASPGLRFAARVIDTVVLTAFWIVAALVTGAFGEALDAQSLEGSITERAAAQDPGKAILAMASAFIAYFVYEGAMLTRSGQTLGKKAVGIRVAVLVNGDIPTRQGWSRAAVYALPGVLASFLVGPIFWLVNSLWLLGDKPYRQCLHDKVAHTVVVDAR
jgi:uncharacterized RDD family membrane protein YckC